jgi:hypothetical protein
MRLRFAAIALCVGLASAAHADEVTINFSSLAADAGQVVSTTFMAGVYKVFVNDSLVIGPGDPGYTGVIGVLPAANNDFDVNLQPIGTVVMTEITLHFAPATSSVVNWNGQESLSSTFWTWSGTTSDLFRNFYPSGILTSTIGTETGTGNGAQLTSIVIDYSSASGIPEPSALILGTIGFVGVAGFVGRTRSRVTRSR